MHIKCPRCHADNPPETKSCQHCGLLLDAADKMPISQTKTIETPIDELTRGATFAERYEIIEELGRGGMGKVYRAEDTKTEEELAIKLIKPEIAADRRTLERFSNEIALAHKISHRNVCRMYHLGEEKGTHFITMEYVPGEDLRSFIRRSGQLSIGTAIRIAKQICEGLSEAHRVKVVHRDLKPSNVMIDKEGHAKIMDFGIAQSHRTKGITGTGVVIGTPEYMSPEQAEAKDVDHRSDLYSLGVIFYEMVTGQVPFAGDTPLSIALKHRSESPTAPKELNHHIPDQLNQLILKCMTKNLEDRFQSSGEILSELAEIEKSIPAAQKESARKKPLTSKEITVSFRMKKIFIPALFLLVFAVIVLVIWHPWSREAVLSSTPLRPSVGVLPFEDWSPEKDQGYLCDGMAESLILALSRVNGLRVPARTSSFSFREKEKNIAEIGEKLGVESILEGSLQKLGNTIRVTAALINVANESVIWSNQWNEDLDDVFKIQDEIALTVVDKLKVHLFREEKSNLTKRYTDNVEAYELYLKGRLLWNKRTPQDMKDSLRYYEEAIEKDPLFALAYAGLADSYNKIIGWLVLPPNEIALKAKAAAKKALEIDSDLVQAHSALAYITYIYDLDLDKAEQGFKKALELDPNYAAAHGDYSELLVGMKRFEEANKEARKALELDPLSLRNTNAPAWFSFYEKKYDQSIQQCRRVIEMAPTFVPVRLCLGWNYEQKGMFDQAIQQFEKVLELSPGFTIAVTFIGRSYALSGRTDKAYEVIDELISQSKEKYVSPFFMAIIYTALREKDDAFLWLEKAFEEPHYWLAMFNVLPWFDSLRDDPRMAALLRKIGLEE
jgi:serine/threonine-protein kinase